MCLFTLAVPCPSGVSLGIPIVCMCGKIPVPSEDRKAAFLGPHAFAYCAHGIHPGFGVVGMEVDAPHIQRTQITSELQNCGSTLGRNHPVGCFETASGSCPLQPERCHLCV